MSWISALGVRIALRFGEPAQRFVDKGGRANTDRGVELVSNLRGIQMGCAERDTDREGCPLIQSTLHRDIAAMQRDKFLDQRETDPAALETTPTRAGHAVKALKEVREFMFRDADAGVADGKLHGFAVERR